MYSPLCNTICLRRCTMIPGQIYARFATLHGCRLEIFFLLSTHMDRKFTTVMSLISVNLRNALPSLCALQGRTTRKSLRKKHWKHQTLLVTGRPATKRGVNSLAPGKNKNKIDLSADQNTMLNNPSSSTTGCSATSLALQGRSSKEESLT